MPTQPCAATGTFSRDQSSTYSRVSSDFDISYVDGEYARGDYGKDTFRFGDGTEVKDLQFGIGLESTSSEGIMGIGMAENEVQVQRLGKKPYKTLVELMVEQGIIKSKAYSLYLNDLGPSPSPCRETDVNSCYRGHNGRSTFRRNRYGKIRGRTHHASYR